MRGSQLKLLRVTADIPQDRLATRLGMGASKLCAIEQDKRPLSEDEYREAVAVIKAMVRERTVAIREAMKQVAA